MEPEPERRVVRAPGSRAPHQFSGRRLRQRGKNIERLEPRYAAGIVYCVPFAGRGTGRNAKYYLFSLNPFAAFCAKGCKGCTVNTTVGATCPWRVKLAPRFRGASKKKNFFRPEKKEKARPFRAAKRFFAI